MDTEMSKSLGGALIGVLLLVAGLMLRLSDGDSAGLLSKILIFGGVIVTFVCAGKIAASLMRGERASD